MSAAFSSLDDLIDALGKGPDAMKAYAARMRERDQAHRRLRMAKSYLGQAAWAAQRDPYEATTVMDDLIDSLVRMVGAMPDEFFDPSEYNYHYRWALDAAEKLVGALRDGGKRQEVLALIAKMEDPSGRTPEEAESFRASAAALREKHGIEVPG